MYREGPSPVGAADLTGIHTAREDHGSGFSRRTWPPSRSAVPPLRERLAGLRARPERAAQFTRLFGPAYLSGDRHCRPGPPRWRNIVRLDHTTLQQ